VLVHRGRRYKYNAFNRTVAVFDVDVDRRKAAGKYVTLRPCDAACPKRSRSPARGGVVATAPAAPDVADPGKVPR